MRITAIVLSCSAILAVHGPAVLAGPPAAATGYSRTYRAYKMPSLSGKIVDDADATEGKAREAQVGKDPNDSLVYGPSETDVPPGNYRVDYRIKVGAVGQGSNCIAELRVYKYVPAAKRLDEITKRKIYAYDFKAPLAYETVSLTFRNTAEQGQLQYLVVWLGQVDMWVDSVRVNAIADDQKAAGSLAEQASQWLVEREGRTLLVTPLPPEYVSGENAPSSKEREAFYRRHEIWKTASFKLLGVQVSLGQGQESIRTTAVLPADAPGKAVGENAEVLLEGECAGLGKAPLIVRYKRDKGQIINVAYSPFVNDRLAVFTLRKILAALPAGALASTDSTQIQGHVGYQTEGRDVSGAAFRSYAASVPLLIQGRPGLVCVGTGQRPMLPIQCTVADYRYCVDLASANGYVYFDVDGARLASRYIIQRDNRIVVSAWPSAPFFMATLDGRSLHDTGALRVYLGRKTGLKLLRPAFWVEESFVRLARVDENGHLEERPVTVDGPVLWLQNCVEGSYILYYRSAPVSQPGDLDAKSASDSPCNAVSQSSWNLFSLFHIEL